MSAPTAIRNPYLGVGGVNLTPGQLRRRDRAAFLEEMRRPATVQPSRTFERVRQIAAARAEGHLWRPA